MAYHSEVVLISDNPMTIGIQCIAGHLNAQTNIVKRFRISVLLASSPKFSKIEMPFTSDEINHLKYFIMEKDPVVIGFSTIERTRARLLSVLPYMKEAAKKSYFIAGGIDAI